MKLKGESLEVALGARSYEIVIGRGLTADLGEALHDLQEEDRPVAAVVDAGFGQFNSGFLKNVLGDIRTLELPSGEKTKSLHTIGLIWDFLAEAGMDRTGRLVVVGGGVTGDVGGFAAASFLRGIGFLQIPTTLLAMVDSSVGGKTGINLASGKNLVGSFHQPVGVWADLDVLGSLPKVEFAAGMAEVIKYGLLGDFALFEELEQGDQLEPASPALARVIRSCCEAKARIVAEDERETTGSGGRALLNLGHTFAHAIENMAGYGDYLHGEAVSVGLVAATHLSERLGSLDSGSAERVGKALQRYDLPTCLRRPLPLDGLLAAMRRDKKVRGGKVRFVVMEGLGHAVTKEGVPTELVTDAWMGVGALK
ncbi:MAG: 3-dehydroquinate synthase [Opitutales bacterium]